jgi:hypothetical protein
LTEKWERLVVKVGAVVAAIASGLLSVQQDTLDDVVRPILNALIVVGLSVGLYRYVGDLIWSKRKSEPEPEIDGDSEDPASDDGDEAPPVDEDEDK